MDEVSDGSVTVDEEVSNLVREKAEMWIAKTEGDSARCRNEDVAEFDDPIWTAWVDKLFLIRCQYVLQNSAWLLVRASLAALSLLANSDFTEKILLVTSAYEYVAQYFWRLWEMKGLTPSMKLW